LPAWSPVLNTEAVNGKLAAGRDGAWRPWTIWLPCALAFAWSGLLVVADGYAAVMGSWDTAARGLGWLGVGAGGQGVLAAIDVGILVAGIRQPRWRRTAALVAWMLIPVGFAWFILTARLSSAG
jgi:hypothetical protein